jgi:hypothetical protein
MFRTSHACVASFGHTPTRERDLEECPLACSQHLPEEITKLTSLVSLAERGERALWNLVASRLL